MPVRKHYRTYVSWQSMKRRCIDPNNKKYSFYGGAGVTVCDRWLHSFANFLSDMGDRPSRKTLDRYPNHSGNYEPGNCRWATNKAQQRNRKSNRMLTAFGETKCLTDWLDDVRCKANRPTLQKRVDCGWEHERAIVAPMKRMKNRTLTAGQDYKRR